jgi:hypothetical protein
MYSQARIQRTDIATIKRRNRQKQRNDYIALEELDFTWNRQEVREFDELWNAGYSLEYIAEHFDRDVDEVAILAMDLAIKGKIGRRPGGVFGNGREIMR